MWGVCVRVKLHAYIKFQVLMGPCLVLYRANPNAKKRPSQKCLRTVFSNLGLLLF